jgi:HAD superfamily hydrolase (TIGR01509 family)
VYKCLVADSIELVIFDCDGVLVDSEPIAVRTHSAVLTALGWPLSEADVTERFVGRSTASINELIEARLGPELTAEAGRRFDRLHREAVDAELAPVDGIAGALAAITLPTCVASSGSHDKMRHTLGRTGLYEHFEGRIFSATQVARGKPEPDLFLFAAREMGVDPARCVVVEDSRYGVQAARAAGMRALGYAGGLTPAEWLEGPGTVVFDDMRDLPGLLGPADGTAGYAEAADALAEQYESVTFADVHREALPFLPAAPARVLDIGAGTGRDAAALAALGHRVVAAEPVAELRAHARRLHAGRPIDWVDDRLPDLPALRERGEEFDLVLLSAVWMHLDASERAQGIKRVAELLAPGATVVLVVRHGPVPPGRRMFDVPVEETVALAASVGLRLVHQATRPDLHGRPGVRMTTFVLS